MSSGSALTRTTVATRKSTKSGKSVSSKASRKQDVCPKHRLYKLDSYCVDHQCLACAICKEDTHGSCLHVLPVAEAAKNFCETDMAFEWSKILRKLLSQCTSVSKERRIDEKELKTSKSGIEHYVKNYRKSIMDKLDQLVNGILKHVDRIYQKEQATIQDNLLQLSKVIKTLEDKLTDIDIAKNVAADLPLFMAVQTAKERHDIMKSTLTTIHDEANKISLKINKDAIQVINLVIGDLETDRKPYDLLPRPKSQTRPSGKDSKVNINKDSKITLLGEFGVRGEDEGKCFITGIRAFQDNYVIMADNSNNCVKFMAPDYNLLETVTMNRPPFDVALKTDTQVAVTSPEGNEIVLVNINERKTMEIGGSVKLNFDCYGIAVFESNYLVTSVSEKCVKMVDMDGAEVWTIRTDLHSDPVFSWPWYVEVHGQSHELYVADRNRNWIVQAYTNGIYRKYFHTEDTGPRGMTIDGKGNLLVCNFMKDEVEMQSVGMLDDSSTLGNKQDGIKHPQCVTMLNGKPHFILASYNSDTVKLYQLN